MWKWIKQLLGIGVTGTTSTAIATKAYVDAQISAIETQISNAGGVQGPQGAAGAPGSVWYTASGAPSSSLGINGDYFLRSDTDDVYHKTGGSWGSPILNLKGIQGTQGAGGANGATWYSGTGAPSTAVGNNGDFYIDKTPGAVTVYGPKASNAWPSGVLLSGTSGTNGAAGTSIQSGAGAPSNSVGNNGDLYVDTTNVRLYGPKASGSWPSGFTQLNPYNFASDGGANTTYTIDPVNDNGKAKGMGAGNSNNMTVTVPVLPQNFTQDFYLEGSGQLAFVAQNSNVVLHARGVTSTTTIHHPGQYDAVTVFCRYNSGGGTPTCDVFILNGVT